MNNGNSSGVAANLFEAMCHAPDTVVLATDSQGVYTFMAGKGLESGHLVPEEFLGKSVYDVFTPSDAALKQIVEALKGKITFGTVKVKDRFYSNRVLPVFDESGTITGAIGFAIDITKQYLEELQTREQERIVDLLFDCAQEAIFIIDKEYNFLKVNKAMQSLHAAHLPLPGKKCYSIYYRDGVCSCCPAQETLRTGRAAKAIQYETISGKGGTWLEQSTFPIFDPLTGEVRAVAGFLMDISEQRKAEEQIALYRRKIEKQTDELKKSEEKLRTILHTNSAAIVFFDKDRRIFYTNTAFEEFTGYSKEELQGKSTSELIDFDDVATSDYLKLREQIFSGKTSQIRSQLKHRRKDGSAAWADICITEFHAKNPAESHYVGILFDTTERHKLIMELQRFKATFDKTEATPASAPRG